MLVCNRKELLDVVKSLSKVTPRTGLKPVIENIMFDSDGDKLRLTATNLEISLCLEIEYSSGGVNQFLLPAHKLRDILSSLDDDDVKFEMDGSFCLISCGKDSFKLFSSIVGEYPEITFDGNESGFKMDGNKLRDILVRGGFSSAKEASRYTMNSILLDIKDGVVKVVSTDGKMLSLVESKLEYDGEHFILLPNDGVDIILDNVIDGEVTVIPQEGNVVFKFGNNVLLVRSLEGTYPLYEAVLKSKIENKYEIDRKEFIKVLKKSLLLTTTDSKSVRFRFSLDKLELDSCDPNIGESHLYVECSGSEELEVHYNPQLLLKTYTHFCGDRISLNFDKDKSLKSDETLDGFEHEIKIMPLSK